MPIKTIDASTLKTWLDNDQAILIDVREPGEYKAEHIPGATLVPLSNVTAEALPEYGEKRLVVHCQLGRRGTTACEKLMAEMPAMEIYNLEGGIAAWRQAGFPLTTTGQFFLPLDQQVQLSIGTGIVLGVVLGFAIHPGFFLLPAFFGFGLMNAGLTGWCGMAKLMAKMPWNQPAKL